MSAEVYHLVPRTMRTIRQQAADLDSLLNFPFKAAARLGLTVTSEDERDRNLTRAIELLSNPENLQRAIAASLDGARKNALQAAAEHLAGSGAAPRSDRLEVQRLAAFVEATLGTIDAEFAAHVGPRAPAKQVSDESGLNREILCRQVAALGEVLAERRNRLATELKLARPELYSRAQLLALKGLCRKELALPDADETFLIVSRRLAEWAGEDLRFLLSDAFARRPGSERDALQDLIAEFSTDDAEEAVALGPSLVAAKDDLVHRVRAALDACDSTPADVRALARLAAIALSRRALRAILEIATHANGVLSGSHSGHDAPDLRRRRTRLARLLLTWPHSAGEAWDEAGAVAALLSAEERKRFERSVETSTLFEGGPRALKPETLEPAGAP